MKYIYHKNKKYFSRCLFQLLQTTTLYAMWCPLIPCLTKLFCKAESHFMHCVAHFKEFLLSKKPLTSVPKTCVLCSAELFVRCVAQSHPEVCPEQSCVPCGTEPLGATLVLCGTEQLCKCQPTMVHQRISNFFEQRELFHAPQGTQPIIFVEQRAVLCTPGRTPNNLCWAESYPMRPGAHTK